MALDRKAHNRLFTGLHIAASFAVMILVISPFYISLVYALKESTDITVNRLAWPEHPTLNNFFRVIFENEQYLVGYKNTILTPIPSVIILMTATSMAAYVLARFSNQFYKGL